MTMHVSVFGLGYVGSVSAAVVARAHCSVEVVREGNQDKQ